MAAPGTAIFAGLPGSGGARSGFIRVEGRDDLAVATCAVDIVHVAPEGGERAVAAKQMLIVRKQDDGRWLISAIIFNAEPQPD